MASLQVSDIDASIRDGLVISVISNTSISKTMNVGRYCGLLRYKLYVVHWIPFPVILSYP